jgi:outer membrane immunogenic protein
MKRTVIVGAVFAALALPAFAADMPMKAPAHVFNPQPVANWTGWNLGVSAGARFADITGTTLSFNGVPPPFPALATQGYDSTTFRGGVYLGYDWQFNPKWLVGLEGDVAWGHATSGVDALQGAPPGNVGNRSQVTQTWDAGLRARLGYLLDPTWLLYVTGGVQWQHFDVFVNCAVATCGPGVLPPFGPGVPFSQTNGVTRTGWAIGGGTEKMLPGNWLVRVEYRYADFGTWTSTFGATPPIVKAYDLATHTAYVGLAKKF